MLKAHSPVDCNKTSEIRYNGRVTDLDDNQLVAQVAQGEEWAFLALYDRYVGRVHALTLRILGEPMLAEEATQDTFLKLGVAPGSICRSVAR